MFVLSWQTGWQFRPGQPYQLQKHDHYILLDIKYVAIYVFTHIFMIVYTGRLMGSSFYQFKLNLVMLVTYGYVAYVNYTLQDLLRSYTDVFYGIMAVAISMAVITIAIMLVRVLQET